VLVLLVEDDDEIAEPLAKGLVREGFEVERVGTAAGALEAVLEPEPGRVPGFVLLDLGLPDGSGLEVCRRIRAASDVPVIMVTARGEEIDRVLGLELGADDYVVKPFGVRELAARIRAVLRRHRGPGDATAPRPAGSAQQVGEVAIDRRTRTVTVRGVAVDLAPKEFDLLAFLADDPGAVRTRTEILDAVWDTNWYGPTKTLDVHVGSLRRKLADPGIIETVRGVGFRLRATPA
jgi:two-component system, OmpR family, response regulator RegX3